MADEEMPKTPAKNQQPLVTFLISIIVIGLLALAFFFGLKFRATSPEETTPTSTPEITTTSTPQPTATPEEEIAPTVTPSPSPTLTLIPSPTSSPTPKPTLKIEMAPIEYELHLTPP